jgi:hypothetical protein
MSLHNRTLVELLCDVRLAYRFWCDRGYFEGKEGSMTSPAPDTLEREKDKL